MSNAVFLVMPQWQGSPSSRAMQLVDGASALREDLPGTATREVAVPLEAGDAMGTPVARLSSLISARDAARQALAGIDGPAIIVGGDGATALAGIEDAVMQTAGADTGTLAVVWLSAHPGLQQPSTSPTGAASQMTLRHVLGDGSPDLVSRAPLDAAQLVFVGLRAADPEESEEIERLGLTALDYDGDEDPATLAARLRAHLLASGAERVYFHIALDVLDPAEFAAVHAPVPFGLTAAQLTETIRTAVAVLPLAGATICEFAPADTELAADGLPTVLRILGALTSGQAR